MRQEWIERMHDQARMEKGVCVQASDGHWCDSHAALKFPGEEACRAMSVAYDIAESAGEVMEELARADERAKAHLHNTGTSSPDACCECCYDVPSLERDHLAARRRVKELVDERADLRAEVEGLAMFSTWGPDGSLSGEDVVLRADVLALFPEERDRG